MLGKIKLLSTLFVLFFLMPIQAYATVSPTYTSPNYSADQVFFGTGGSLNQSSPNYSAQVTVGETGVGNFVGSAYQAYSGFNTTADPFLQIELTCSNLNLGVLNTAVVTTGTACFFVRAWDAHGYVVQTDGNPPQNGSHTFCTRASYTSPCTQPPLTSSPGTEQFGMNLVADTTGNLSNASDTCPVSSNPIQATVKPSFSIPSTISCPTGYSIFPSAPSSCPPTTSSYIAYGCAYGNYATANNYYYNNGDIIAESNQSTGATIYTMSYIFNISSSTPGGQYTFNQSLVATTTY
jgi:hypothetical protein